jgi:hypothetical protein
MMENTSGGRKVNIQNDMPPKNKIKNDTSLSQLLKDSSGNKLFASDILLSFLQT